MPTIVFGEVPHTMSYIWDEINCFRTTLCKTFTFRNIATAIINSNERVINNVGISYNDCMHGREDLSMCRHVCLQACIMPTDIVLLNILRQRNVTVINHHITKCNFIPYESS